MQAAPQAPVAPALCRKRHPQTKENVRTYLRAGKPARYCILCREAREGSLGERVCIDCGEKFRRRGSSDRCQKCQNVYVDGQETPTTGRGGRGDGRRPDSPYEIARVQVETMYGVPAKEWMNKKLHPLNVLHYARMISIYNSRKLGPPIEVPAKGVWSTIGAIELIKRAGLKPKRRQAA